MPHVKFVLERLLINPKMGQIKIICSENSNWHLWDIVSSHCVLETNEQVRKSLLKTKKGGKHSPRNKYSLEKNE